MADINKVVISGRLTRDPERRDTATTPITHLCVAVNDRVKRGDKWEDYANFIDVAAFGRLAEFAAQDLRRGDAVTVEGRLHWSSWEADGHKKSKVEVNATNIVYARTSSNYAPRPMTQAQLQTYVNDAARDAQGDAYGDEIEF